MRSLAAPHGRRCSRCEERAQSWGGNAALRHTCNHPWDALFLLSDGTMSVCRFDFDARIRIGRYGEQSIPELWNGQKMMSLRKAHMDFDFKDWAQCENCTATWYENRHEHFVLSRKLMKRNGVAPARNGWLSQNPLAQRMGADENVAS